MADIVSIHDYDAKPEVQKGQYLFFVGERWVVTNEPIEPSPLEVRVYKLEHVLDEKQIVTKEETDAKPVPVDETGEITVP